MNSQNNQPKDVAAHYRKGVSIAETARQQEEAEKLTGPTLRSFKCAVRGCNNHFGEGHFVGALCFPCDAMLRSGVVPPGGATFIHDLYYDVQRLEAKAHHDKAWSMLMTACEKARIELDPNTRETIVSVIIAAIKGGEEHERSKGQS